ncbi:hypothetical protein AKJ16_DCAP00470 [Drosera capensis]
MQIFTAFNSSPQGPDETSNKVIPPFSSSNIPRPFESLDELSFYDSVLQNPRMEVYNLFQLAEDWHSGLTFCPWSLPFIPHTLLLDEKPRQISCRDCCARSQSIFKPIMSMCFGAIVINMD